MPVSIFNEVLGPVMCGPSSSHTAASWRIGKVARDLFGGPVKHVLAEFAPLSSLATTYRGHGSDIGLAAGLLGVDMESPDITECMHIAREQGLEIRFGIREFGNDHPNAYRLTLTSADGREMQMTALSTGGGMIRVVEVDGFPVDMEGGYFELLLFISGKAGDWGKTLWREPAFTGLEEVSCRKGLLELKFSQAVSEETINRVLQGTGSNGYRYANPVLPVLSRKNCRVPFRDAYGLLQGLPDRSAELWEMAVKYEAERGNISENAVFELAGDVYRVMRKAVETGLSGTVYSDRILGRQSHLIGKAAAKGLLIPAPLMNRISQYTMAVMEAKSAFKPIVAAPTAGSCAVLPGAILGCVDECRLSEEEGIKALLAAGLIGVFIATRSTFAAELAGCQAECGSASGMAAAGLVQLMGGNAETALGAASFALQNVMGMVCDPVANRVEVPCLGKNILSAVNGLTAANLSLAGVNTVIPLDEVIDSLDKVGRALPAELRCTGKGGLSLTPAARKIEGRLKKNDPENEETI